MQLPKEKQFMAVNIQINNTNDINAAYVTWTPAACRIRSADETARTVVLSNKDTTRGGQIWFMTSPEGTPSDTLQIGIAADGSFTPFFIAGKFIQSTRQAFASSEDKDTILLAVDAATGVALGETALMVRVRKNADKISPHERHIFLDALVKLNRSGGFVELQRMHVISAFREIHARSCFLPWHRAYLLDLERKLQAITPAVTLPYWKFDANARNVFNRDFMGIPDSTGAVGFPDSNPLSRWTLQMFGFGSGAQIRRLNLGNLPGNQTVNWDPVNAPRAVLVQNNEDQTLNNFGQVFSQFGRRIEGDPHASAHNSFTGQITSIGESPADPLFFMLHCNVDRLWAKWQYARELFAAADINAYPHQGNGPRQSGENGIGNYTDDTMWAWNQDGIAPRPNFTPGNGFPNSPVTAEPGSAPTVAQMIDFQGQLDFAKHLNFAYDDVPYDFQ